MRVTAHDQLASRTRSFWVATALAALVLIAYGRTLQNGFAFDDFPYLVDNPFVRSPQRLIDVLFDARTHTAAGNVVTYRPLRTLLFAAEFHLFGERAALFHAVNLVLHTGVVVLVWRLAGRLVSPRFAFVIAAVFACHPLQSEVVASIKAQDDLMASLAVIWALLVFDFSTRESPRSARRWFVLVPFAIGMLAKENVVALPILLSAWSWIVMGQRRIDLTLIGGMGLFAIAFLALRSSALPASTAPDALEGHWLFPGAVAAIPQYAKLFVWPHPLSIDYPGITALALSSWKLWLSVALQIAACVWAWRSGLRVVRLGLVWFYVLLFPSLNPLGSVVVFAERFAYLPIAGLTLVVAGCVQNRVAGIPRTLVTMACSLLLAALAATSFVRCGDWKNTESLLRAALQADPASAMARTALRRELVVQGRGSEVVAPLPQADEIRPPKSFMERAELSDRGLMAAQQGRFEEAMKYYTPIVSTSFAQWDDWLNYGTCLANGGDSSAAKKAFERALELRPGAPSVLRMMARLDMEAEQWSSALERLRDAVQREPDHVLGWYFYVYVSWKGEGEQSALLRLSEARARNVALGPLIKSDWPRWDATAGALRQQLRRLAVLESDGSGG